MKTDEQNPLDEYDVELARRLCAAVVSMQLRVSLQHAYKTYVDDTPGDSWIRMAKALREKIYGRKDKQ